MKQIEKSFEKYDVIANYFKEKEDGYIISWPELLSLNPYANEPWDIKEVKKWINKTKQPVSSLGYGLRKLSQEELYISNAYLSPDSLIDALEKLSLFSTSAVNTAKPTLAEYKSPQLRPAQNPVIVHMPLQTLDSNHPQDLYMKPADIESHSGREMRFSQQKIKEREVKKKIALRKISLVLLQ